MLIIFDLDDTLIDTTGSITPGLLKNALHTMQRSGLLLSDFDRAYDQLLRLNRHHISSKSALLEFLEIYQAPESCLVAGLHELYQKPKFVQPVEPLEDAAQVLTELAESHQLALVTKGNERIQREKIESAKLPIKIFSYLCFCEMDDKLDGKKSFYASLGKEIGISPSQVLVCGDRIAIDLAPAKELGYNTVQMRWGRGLGNTGLKKDVDYTILNLGELIQIVEKLK